LAGKLTGYEIDVFREGVEEDIELKEFSDEIEEWVIDEFKKSRFRYSQKCFGVRKI